MVAGRVVVVKARVVGAAAADDECADCDCEDRENVAGGYEARASVVCANVDGACEACVNVARANEAQAQAQAAPACGCEDCGHARRVEAGGG